MNGMTATWQDYSLEHHSPDSHYDVRVICRSDGGCEEFQSNAEGAYLTLGEAVEWAKGHVAEHDVLELESVTAERDYIRQEAKRQLQNRDDEIRRLGQILLSLTKPADGEHCCDVIGNAWGHSPLCKNTPPITHPDDRT